MKNENKGLEILYQNALAGSVVNSDVLFRAMERDLDAANESLGHAANLDALRSKDRNIIIDIVSAISNIDANLNEQINKHIQSITSHVSKYVQASSLENLDEVLQTLSKFREDLQSLDETINYAIDVIQVTFDDITAKSVKSKLEEVIANLNNLSTHATQLFIVVLTAEGSANQCRMTY